MKTRIFAVALASGPALALSACAHDYGADHDDGYPSYNGGQYGASGIGGSGVKYLDPWLSNTEVGRLLVLKRFDRDWDGRVDAKTAQKANSWFRRYADSNRDMQLTDWEIDQGLQRLAVDYRYY